MRECKLILQWLRTAQCVLCVADENNACDTVVVTQRGDTRSQFQ